MIILCLLRTLDDELEIISCLHAGLIPYDGTPREEIVTIALPVTIICSALNICGIICAVICLLFNIIFRKKKSIGLLSHNIYKTLIFLSITLLLLFFYYRLVRLDSPNLNYLIISGTTMVFAGGIAIVAPTLNPGVVSALCIVCQTSYCNIFKPSYPIAVYNIISKYVS